MLSLFYMELNGFPLLHACVNVRFPSPPARRYGHAWPCTRITPLDRMGTPHILHAHVAGSQEARRRDGRLPRRPRRAQWEDVVYCFSPWGKGARDAKGECLGLIHVARPMTDVARDPNYDLELVSVVDIMERYRWNKKVRKGRRRSYENEKVLAKYALPKAPSFLF